MRGAKALFETVEYPALMHCKSGADRAGIMAVFYRHFRQGRPIREALAQLSPRYLHVRAGLTGVLDYIFERYLAEGEPAGLSFLDWVESPAYDPAAHQGRLPRRLVGHAADRAAAAARVGRLSGRARRGSRRGGSSRRWAWMMK